MFFFRKWRTLMVSGRSALAYAFENKNLEIMKVLLENGANSSLIQSNGSTDEALEVVQ
jgi:ankyrin repeat protein